MTDLIIPKNAGYDYRQPFYRATIVRPDGIRIPLWTKLDLTEDERQSIGFYYIRSLSYVKEVSINLQLAYLPIMKVSMSFPYREGIEFLNSKAIEWGYSELEIVFGYTGGSPDGLSLAGIGSATILSPTYKGVLLQPSIDISPAEVNITLNAQGVGGFSANNTTRQGGPYFGSRRAFF